MIQPKRTREGAPTTETPEEAAAPPAEAEVVLESPTETPEEPVAPPVEALSESVPAGGDLIDPEVEELHRHVASSPVHSHAPAWGPREPNVEGGYQ